MPSVIKLMYSTTNLILLSSPGSIADSISEVMPSHFQCDSISSYSKTYKQVIPKNKSKFENAHVIILNLAHTIIDSNQIILRLKSITTAPLIILHHYNQKVFADAFISMGASAYLPINFQSEELLLAVEKVLEGKKFISTYVN